jgi:5-methylcytosine-specific restriction endonuclease McrA
MGLPRYLATKFEARNDTQDGWEMLLEAMVSGADLGHRVFEILNPKNGKAKPPRHHVTLSVIQCRWRWFELRKFKDDSVDSLTRISGKLYVGLERVSYGAPVAEYRDVKIAKFCAERLAERNKVYEARDRVAAEKQAEIVKYKNKVYASRTFPPKLKAIIFERDNYCCRQCLRGRGELAPHGLHLECDHIVAYEDGGLTTYENGQTLCNECNIAKHHAKRYFQHKESLRLA